MISVNEQMTMGGIASDFFTWQILTIFFFLEKVDIMYMW